MGLQVAVALMDGSTQHVSVDGTTTARHLANTLCTKLGIRETFGFSIYIAMYGKVSESSVFVIKFRSTPQ